jgi:hypothetical protein
MCAGSIGMLFKASGEHGEEGLGTISPLYGWPVYEKLEETKWGLDGTGGQKGVGEERKEELKEEARKSVWERADLD